MTNRPPADPMSRTGDGNAQDVKVGRELDAKVAEALGHRVSWWSLHLADSLPPADEENVTWRHGMFSRRGLPAEIQRADQMGDMPLQFMLVGDDEWTGIPRYSSNIADAFAVVSELVRQNDGGWDFNFSLTTTPHGWLAEFYSRDADVAAGPFDAGANTPAEAICRAALYAVETEAP